MLAPFAPYIPVASEARGAADSASSLQGRMLMEVRTKRIQMAAMMKVD